MLIVAGVILPWWEITFFDNCDNIFIVMYLRQGMCIYTIDPDKEGSDETVHCIDWLEGSKWEEIDALQGTNTEYDAKYKYNYGAMLMMAIAMALSTMQLILCLLVQFRFLRASIRKQKAILFSVVSVMGLVMASQSIGSATDLTAIDTWDFYDIGCTSATSTPTSGYLVTNTVVQVFVLAIIAVLTLPEKFWYVYV
jgi:hypothetical protein